MASGQDDVLSYDCSEVSGEFSGFSPLSGDEVPAKKKKKLKTKGKTPKSKEKQIKNTDKPSGTNDVRPNAGFDLASLGPEDIVKLRSLLGINPQVVENDSDDSLNMPFEDLPRLTVQVDPKDISGGESPDKSKPRMISCDLAKALFEDSENKDNDWDLPRLKTPERGEAISSSLANLINTSCTTQCETESLIQKYRVPLNCEMLTPPLVNSEIWKIMDRRVQSQDRGIVETQNLIAASMIPIIKLAEILRSHITSNTAAKTLITDALTLIGQVQFNLSVRRRYMIRPVLKKKYHSLCNISMPITTKLFGDDVAKDIKSCDSLISLGKEQYQSNYQRPYQNRGRGYSRRGSYNAYQNTGRYQPYPNNRGQQKPWNKNYKIPKKSATATVNTAPNEQNL